MKNLIVCLLACTLLLGACSADEINAVETIIPDDNQSIVIGQITALYGNDITLALAEEMEFDASDGTMPSGDFSGQMPDGQTMETDESGNIVMPDGWATETDESGNIVNQMPGGRTTETDESGNIVNQMPGGRTMETDESGNIVNQMPGGRTTETDESGNIVNQMPGGRTMETDESGNIVNQMPGAGNSADADTTDDQSGNSADEETTIYSLTGGTLDTSIPVGTDVTTQLGTVTTFSRLAVGDMIKLLVETSDDGAETVVGVWIVG